MSKILGIFPKANELGIFIYASALFFFVVYATLYQIEISSYVVGIFGIILVLLLYRYFHEIKFGGLSLKKEVIDNDNKFEVFKSSSSTVINDLKNEFETFKSSASKTIVDLSNEFDTFKTSSVEEILELKGLLKEDKSGDKNSKTHAKEAKDKNDDRY